MTDTPQLDEREYRLVSQYQQGLPLDPRPFARMAEQLQADEAWVIETLRRLQQEGIVSRVGPVIRPNSIGVSTLVAMAVPPEDLERVAAIVNEYPEVNHNYEREHRYNLWFVVTAPNEAHLAQVLDGIRERTGFPLLDLPMLEDYFIDLGFPLQWT
ncbi:MAG: Lrp/AsnC family transcriptional regulator [Gammaproteobacteria bacterium]|nr:MAG: Lrp/AsnC family transcriptional regulator [Gammaproteobacteria bacterium]